MIFVLFYSIIVTDHHQYSAIEDRRITKPIFCRERKRPVVLWRMALCLFLKPVPSPGAELQESLY